MGKTYATSHHLGHLPDRDLLDGLCCREKQSFGWWELLKDNIFDRRFAAPTRKYSMLERSMETRLVLETW